MPWVALLVLLALITLPSIALYGLGLCHSAFHAWQVGRLRDAEVQDVLRPLSSPRPVVRRRRRHTATIDAVARGRGAPHTPRSAYRD